MALMLRSVQTIRSVSARAMSSHWDNLTRLVPNSKKREMTNRRTAISKRQSVADATKPLPEIDWDAYTAVLGADAVAPIKAEYESQPAADVDAEVSKAVARTSSKMAELKDSVTEIVAGADALATQAAQELKVLERSRTDENTSLEEVLRRYPEIYETLVDRLENENFDINYPAVDAAAIRLATVKQHWDTEKLGPLTEEAIAEVVEEMDALQSESAGNEVTFDQLRYSDFSDDKKAEFEEMHKQLGLELTDDLIAQYDALPDPRQLTVAETAIKDEAEIVKQIEFHLNIDNDGASYHKAEAFYQHMADLRHSGDLVANVAGMERFRIENCTHSLAPMEIEQFEGKSAEELASLAEDSAAAGNYYEACMYLYESKVVDGTIDPTARNDSFSGAANLSMQMSENMVEFSSTGRKPVLAQLL